MFVVEQIMTNILVAMDVVIIMMSIILCMLTNTWALMKK